ncbi:MAG: lysine--tRNA ligase [Candidatus Jacksonbacteria bacterium]
MTQFLNKSHDERSIRIERLKKIRSHGINPYPATSNRTHEIGEAIVQFDQLDESQANLTIAGRIMSLRGHGGSTFADLDDGSARMQVYLKKDEIIEHITHNMEQGQGLSYQDFINLVDVGDFIEVEGSVFLTKKGEKTLKVKSWAILTKAIKPIPSKWYGIKDQETRYRKRYLDLLINSELREMFFRKARFWNSMREILLSKGFLEVYTPILENTTGGADAKPFATHHNALDIDVYLRISMGELWQKRLMVAGFSKTFEIGRQFRNEGIDPEHLQDYMQMEYYWAYADFNQGMELTEELIKHIAIQTFKTLKFKINGMDVDLGQKWGRIDFSEEIKKQLKIDVKIASIDGLKSKLDKLKIEYEVSADKGRLMDLLWKQCRKNIMGPAYLINVPVAISPLAKRSEKDPETTQRFQLILAGSELCNGYSELNDPLDQRERFLEQACLRDAGDEEAQMNDEDFVEALEYGMPPVCGLGISERLFSFLEGKSIRECVMFPLLRPIHGTCNMKHETVENRHCTVSEKGDIGITREQAIGLLKKYIKNQNLIKHHLAAEAQMRALAEYFLSPKVETMHASSLQIDPNAWAMAGFLHDIDWEQAESTPEKHSLIAEEILNKKSVRADIIKAIKIHNHLHGLEPQTLMEKALYCAEELTGLVVAAALVQPDKKLASVDAESVIKKFKDKSFARGVNREIILKCKEYLGLELHELTEITIAAMQGVAPDLGL